MPSEFATSEFVFLRRRSCQTRLPAHQNQSKRTFSNFFDGKREEYAHTSLFGILIIFSFFSNSIRFSGSTVIIIGAGPVGLAAALLLAKRGFQSITVYEGRDSIPVDPEESYPIGINPRALHTLFEIDPQLERRAIREGRIVDSWEIYGGSRQVRSYSCETYTQSE